MSKEIGQQLLTARTVKKLTIRQLSDITGIPWSTIYNYEQGNHNQKPKILKKLEAALNIQINIPDNQKPGMESVKQRTEKAIQLFQMLNESAQIRALERLTEMTMLPQYRKDWNDNNTMAPQTGEHLQ